MSQYRPDVIRSIEDFTQVNGDRVSVVWTHNDACLKMNLNKNNGRISYKGKHLADVSGTREEMLEELIFHDYDLPETFG